MEFSFSNIVNQAKSFLASATKKQGSMVGIDVGTSAIKMVQVKDDHGTIVLETYGELALAPYGDTPEPAGKITNLLPEKIIAAIKDLTKQANITAKNAYFSLASSSSLVFLIKLPAELSESELAQVVPNEARKFIPVPLTEVSLDWFVVPRKETYDEEMIAGQPKEGERKSTEVLVVAVRNEILEQFQKVMNGSGFAVSGFELEMFSIIRSVMHRELAPVLIADIGASSARIAVVEYGVVRSFHVTNRGGAFVTDSLARSMNVSFEKAEEEKREVGMKVVPGKESIAQQVGTMMGVVVNEIKTVMAQYERDSRKAVSKIVLVGGASMTPGLREKIMEDSKIETVYGDPFGKTKAPEFLHPALVSAGPEFAVAVGCGLKDFL